MIEGKLSFLTSRCSFSVDGESLGVLKYSYLRPKASFGGKEGDYLFFREKGFNGSFFLTNNASFIATAQKPNDVGFKYEVQFENRIYKLIPGDLFYERNALHFVVLSDEQELGVIAAVQREIEIAVDPIFPASVQVFMFWLSFISWIAETVSSQAHWCN